MTSYYTGSLSLITSARALPNRLKFPSGSVQKQGQAIKSRHHMTYTQK